MAIDALVWGSTIGSGSGSGSGWEVDGNGGDTGSGGVCICRSGVEYVLSSDRQTLVGTIIARWWASVLPELGVLSSLILLLCHLASFSERFLSSSSSSLLVGPSYPNTMTSGDPTYNDPSSLDMDVDRHPTYQKTPYDQNGVTRTKKYAELSAAEKIQADCDMKATNIILQGLPANIYSLVNHHRVSKDLWERVQLLMQGDDPIACLNKVMAFLTAVASSRFPSTNNQLRTSPNLRNQATIQHGRSNATSSGGNNASGQARVVKCYNCQGEGHMARQCTQPKRPKNATWYKDKAMLAEAQEAGQILDEEQLAFPADPGVLDGQAIQTIIPNNAAFQ
ncbi:retrovirus-related pol polyprotein from transposon TNT 1-94, partial [Tanacetum coccineum]